MPRARNVEFYDAFGTGGEGHFRGERDGVAIAANDDLRERVVIRKRHAARGSCSQNGVRHGLRRKPEHRGHGSGSGFCGRLHREPTLGHERERVLERKRPGERQATEFGEGVARGHDHFEPLRRRRGERVVHDVDRGLAELRFPQPFVGAVTNERE